MDTQTHDRFAIRCIVVSTQSAIASLGRSMSADPERRDELQTKAMLRGIALLEALQAENEPMSAEFRTAIHAARLALKG